MYFRFDAKELKCWMGGWGGSPQTFQFLVSDIHRKPQNVGVLCKSGVPKLLEVSCYWYVPRRVFLCWCYRVIVFKNNPNRLGSNQDII